jgi:hypothetical protein
VPLQTLVNDAVVQLQLAYRHDPAERQRRYEVIGQAIAAWNKSTRTAADTELLSEWLRRSIRASMPGSREALPPAPEFAKRPVPPEEMPLPKATPDAAAPTSPAAAAQGSAEPSPTPGNPFADDKPSAPNHNDANGQNEVAQPGDKLPAVLTGQSTEPPGDRMEGDPFRDDPLPAEGGR